MSHSIDENPEAIRTAEMPELGRQLQQARESLALSIEEVSNRLRLSSRQIKALESDDFPALPEPMITRGFIRNYARLLEIDPEPLLEAYRAHVPSEPPRAISIQSENILISGNDGRSWMVYTAGSILVIILLGLWLYADDLPQSLAQKPAAVSIPVAPESEPANDPFDDAMPTPALPAAERMSEDEAAAEADTAEDTGAVSAPVPTPVEQSASTFENKPVATASAAVVRLTFNEKTWVSVTDGNNVEILNKTKPEGSEEVIEGKPPFRVVIGNAAGSKLVYNGALVDLEPHTRLNVARITLE